MCGIVGYIGSQPILPILIEGLKRLEYRGYDSAGISIVVDGKIYTQKTAGKISNLEKLTHVGETLLSKLRDGELLLSAEITSALLAMVDAVRTMLTSIEQAGNDGTETYADLIEELERLTNGEIVSKPEPKQAAKKKAAKRTPKVKVKKSTAKPAASTSADAAAARAVTIVSMQVRFIRCLPFYLGSRLLTVFSSGPTLRRL